MLMLLVSQCSEKMHSVAPLRIVKSQSPLPTARLHGTHIPAGMRQEHTPPPSPIRSIADDEPRNYASKTDDHWIGGASNGVHGNGASHASSLSDDNQGAIYLRALHSFKPSAHETTGSVCLELEPSQIIQVHTLHSSGWADGTLLANGNRGWFPSNYCEPYTLSAMRPLLSAAALLHATVRSGRLNHYQAAVACIVSGVRGLLVGTDCLTRESDIIKRDARVRKQRKLLLSSLSSLVHLARRTPHSGYWDDAQRTHELTVYSDELQARTDRIITRASRFLETLNIGVEHHAPLSSSESTNAGSHHTRRDSDETNVLPTPPMSGTSFDFAQQAAALELARPIEIGGNGEKRHVSESSSLGFTSLSSSSSTHTGDSFSPTTPLSKRFARDTFALARLSITHDTLLSHLAAYIGRLHLQSRSPAQLLDTTRQSVIAAKHFLVVIDAVCARSRRLSIARALETCRETMYHKISSLLSAAREVVVAHSNGAADDEGVIPEEECRRLVGAATDCVRSAGECVAKARFVVETIGDFEISTTATDRRKVSEEIQGARARKESLLPSADVAVPVSKLPFHQNSQSAYEEQFVGSTQAILQSDAAAKARFEATFSQPQQKSEQTDLLDTPKAQIQEPIQNGANDVRDLAIASPRTMLKQPLFASPVPGLKLADTLKYAESPQIDGTTRSHNLLTNMPDDMEVDKESSLDDSQIHWDRVADSLVFNSDGQVST